MSLFGYFDVARRAMAASQLGLRVAGDNIANAATPGFARRRVELAPGPPIAVAGGWLDQGVSAVAISRAEDRFLQATLERERGGLGSAEENLRGLRDVESVFGPLEGDGIGSRLAEFAAAFRGLAAQPESAAARRGAVSAAAAVAGSLRDAASRLEAQRRSEDAAAGETVRAVDALATELADLNRRIAQDEAGGGVSAPLRDRRELVLERLADLTGGAAANGPDGRVSFELPAGATLVSGDSALPLRTERAADGTLRVLAGGDGTDLTARLRGGRLGAQLRLRDATIPERLAQLDALAADLITRANAMTSGATDLRGAAGGPLFVPDPPSASGSAASIAVAQDLLRDPAALAVSASGAPGDGSVAALLGDLTGSASAALGGRSPEAFLSDALATIGHETAAADTAAVVARDLVNGLATRRDSVSGVSLDEEAVELIRNQRAFEAAARFVRVLDEITETAVGLVSR